MSHSPPPPPPNNKNPWVKGFLLLGLNRLTPLLGWLHSCFVSHGRAHLVSLRTSCLL